MLYSVKKTTLKENGTIWKTTHIHQRLFNSSMMNIKVGNDFSIEYEIDKSRAKYNVVSESIFEFLGTIVIFVDTSDDGDE